MNLILCFSSNFNVTFVPANSHCTPPFCDIYWTWKTLASNTTQIRSADRDDDDAKSRLSKIFDKIRSKIDRTVESVESDIFKANVNRVVLALSNGIAGKSTKKYLNS